MRWHLILPLALCLSGCAETNSIYHNRQIKPNNSAHMLTIDAKQRSIIFNPEEDISTNNIGDGDKQKVKNIVPHWRICAEAAPDVFSAYAASASGKGGTDGKSVSAQFGFSSSETAATIERTQAINMLRESMYRTCERYLSGATSKTIFITQAARDQRSMIAFLAIEQLTRAVRPSSTIISGPATSTSIKDGEAAAKLIEEFRKESGVTDAAAKSAKSDFDTKDAKAKCSTQDAAAKDPDADKQAQLEADFQNCLQAKIVLSAKNAANKQAQERLDQALKIGGDLVSAIGAATSSGAVNAGGGGGAPNEAGISAIASAVVEISTKANIDESLMFCIGYLSDIKSDTSESTRTTCNNILAQRAEVDRNYLAESLGQNETIYRSPAPSGDLGAYLNSGSSKGRRQKLMRLQRYLKSLGLASDAKAIINLTSGVMPELAKSALIFLNGPSL